MGICDENNILEPLGFKYLSNKSHRKDFSKIKVAKQTYGNGKLENENFFIEQYAAAIKIHDATNNRFYKTEVDPIPKKEKISKIKCSLCKRKVIEEELLDHIKSNHSLMKC